MLKYLLFAVLLLSAFFTTINAQVTEDKAKKAEFVNVMLTEHSYAAAQIVDKLFTFNISPSFWDELNKSKQSNDNDVAHTAFNAVVSEVVRYAQRENIGDLDALRIFDKSKEKANRPEVDAIINKLKGKFSIVINAPMEARGRGYEMFLRYPYQIMIRLGSQIPNGVRLRAKRILSSTSAPMPKTSASKRAMPEKPTPSPVPLTRKPTTRKAR